MVIENNSNIKSIPINRVKFGESFIYNNCLHIKIDKGCINVNSDFSNVVVNLENNRLNILGDDIMVILVNAKIVVE